MRLLRILTEFLALSALFAALLLLWATVGAAQAIGPTVGPNSTMSWSDADTSITSYQVLLCTTGAGCTAGATGVTTVTVTPTPLTGTVSIKLSALGTLTTGQKFACVKAVNVNGASVCSNEVPFAFISAVPAPPSSLTVTP